MAARSSTGPAPPRRADVGISEGVITEIGVVDGPAARIIAADGLLVTPGWIDIHTRYKERAPATRGSRPRSVRAERRRSCGIAASGHEHDLRRHAPHLHADALGARPQPRAAFAIEAAVKLMTLMPRARFENERPTGALPGRLLRCGAAAARAAAGAEPALEGA